MNIYEMMAWIVQNDKTKHRDYASQGHALMNLHLTGKILTSTAIAALEHLIAQVAVDVTGM